MKKVEKLKPSNKSKLLFISGALAVIVVLAFLFRGWVRMTAIPKTIDVFYGDSAQKILEKEAAKLQDPLTLLGYRTSDINFKADTCFTDRAKGISTQVYCSYGIGAYREIAQDSDSKVKLNANADKLQNLLKQNGWVGQFTEDGQYTSLKKLMSSITSGIDYQPDAAYLKQIGNTLCSIDSNTAFSIPKPPAINTQFSCSRIFNVLGTPSFEL